jgi:hypothetical protein
LTQSLKLFSCDFGLLQLLNYFVFFVPSFVSQPRSPTTVPEH